MTRATEPEENAAIPTFGEEFPDGAIIEPVREDGESERLKLLYWDGSNVSIAPRVNRNGKVFIPPLVDERTLKAVQLPTHTNNYGSTRELGNDLRCWLGQHPGLSEESVSLLLHHVMASWLPECIPMAPCLSIVTPDASTSTLLLSLLHCAYRHSLRVGELTGNGMLSLPLSLRPTLIIDQPKPTQEVQRMLRAMSRPGVLLPRNGQLRDIYCFTVICTAEPLTDPWLLDNTIQVVLTPTRNHLPRVDPQSLSEIAHNLHAKLLLYRLINFARVRQSQFDAPELTFPTRDIARALGACIVDDTELQSHVIALLEGHDEESRVRRSMTIAAIVIEAGLFFCHEDKRESAYVGEFTTVSNAILKGRGETLELESRAVGDVLRSVGLFTRRLGSAGRGILLLNDIQRKIHRLAWSYDVRSIQDGIDRCKFCAEVRLQLGRMPERET